MDVTSLLNGSLAVERQAGEVIRLPTRSRTPWDAGGYSLTLNSSATRSPVQALESEGRGTFEPVQHSHYDDSPANDTPTYPVHKFTDSRSSMSSFTSSLHSATHSRLSSISTIDSTHTLSSTLVVQSFSPLSTAQRLGLQSCTSSEDSSHSDSTFRLHALEWSSPDRSLDTLVASSKLQVSKSPELSSRLKLDIEGGDQGALTYPHNEESSTIKGTVQNGRYPGEGATGSTRNENIFKGKGCGEEALSSSGIRDRGKEITDVDSANSKIDISGRRLVNGKAVHGRKSSIP